MFGRKYLSSLFRCYSTKIAKWEPWEDQLIRDYVKHNGRKWSAISQHCLPNRLPQQCEVRWDAINPNYRQGPFSQHELQLLEKGMEKYGTKFSKIQKEFLPNRATRRLHHEWSNKSSKEGWAEEEDNLLLKGISQFGLKNWKKISETHLPHRSPPAIRYRYMSVLDPSLKKNPTFTQEELDTILKRTIIFGQDWLKVAEGLPGRTPMQCSHIWRNKLDPSLNKDPWSEKETRLLWELLYRLDGAFYKAAEYLPGRHRQMCNAKFRKEMKTLQLLLPEEIKQMEDENKTEWIKRMAYILGETTDKNLKLHTKPNGELELHQSGSWTKQESEHLQELINAKFDSNDIITESDWKEIASHIPGRSHKQCRYYFLEHLKNNDHIKGKWTKEEDDLLEQLVDQYGKHWKLIAEKFNNRTPSQCNYRWHRVLEYPNAVMGERLTDQEKLLIKEGVLMFGNNWKAISATYLPHRTPTQCRRWWNFQRKKNNTVEDEEIPIKSEQNRWTEDEDKILSFVISGYENSDAIPWSKVASMVPGRNAAECRTRWLYSLKPDTSKRWSYEEEMQLLEIVQKLRFTDLNNIWPTVAKELNTGRDDWQCRRKFNYMQRTGNRFAV